MEKYDVISVVGEGSYGLVMRCRHRESGQYVAIKKFLETEDDPTVRKMAIREIRMLKKLRHENLVNMIEVFRRKKRFFLVFEYLEHTILEELEARSGGGLGFITSRKYIYQVLRALDFIHSNNVIHRDIKPENVLVSRLGVIKLCDFGFARPFQENETFTDYVATRWYRSPELLVGDPRYGKEVDIWATGCLYSEMMTGEPLFPGESDVDQLFQIVRVLGKVNSRHQLLITRNTMFKGMKQEQNSSLLQMFPDWNRDSLNFLGQCLKMDGASRLDTTKLLKHDLFTRDDFVDNFLPELRSKISQELQGNPLLKRLQNMMNPLRKHEERKLSTGSVANEKLAREKAAATKGQIGLSLTQILNQNQSHPPDKTSMTKFPEPSSIRSSQGSDELNFNLAHYKHYLTNQHNKSLLNSNSKSIHINNLTLTKENHQPPWNGGNLKYGARILSAKHHKPTNSDKNSSGENATSGQPIQPPSPVQFQSLQHESVTSSQFTNLMDKHLTQNSPMTINNLTLNGNSIPSYFANKRTTNLLSNRPPISQVINSSNQMAATKYSPLPIGPARVNLAKRERGMLLDVGHLPYGTTASPADVPTKPTEPSPRVLPTPAWLGNLKITSHGKTTQIGKKGLTDWKSVGQNNNATQHQVPVTSNSELLNHLPEISLPNCPGASSPTKTMKKKLTPMTNLTSSMHHPNVSFATPRNISASSPKEES